ncbi:MAG: 2-amino-4-hydroxy-6-hydroxymethyldihydropteridine diphosphokinase [Legionellales bacterium]|jgi:2-amino-4-hydroxy-6-hydroxymethyldihydropteridine diphosphokinase|nr:2-amino-4-hydroxy-6-hydroxymethyldihydropteridine diphosphokinase [Legionellales bacterium]
MAIVYLALGSNLDMPRRQLTNALKHLQSFPRTYILARSKIYLTKPFGIKAQPNYLNMVVAIKTSLSPHALLIACKKTEKKQCRIRKKIWGARSIDIDILLYEQKVIQQKGLTVPHPQLLLRDFVLVPLLEISPNQCLPCGQKILFTRETTQTIMGCRL